MVPLLAGAACFLAVAGLAVIPIVGDPHRSTAVARPKRSSTDIASDILSSLTSTTADVRPTVPPPADVNDLLLDLGPDGYELVTDPNVTRAVPIANLIMPIQIVTALWRASDPDPRRGAGSGGWERAPVDRRVGWWWASFVGLGVVTTMTLRASSADASAVATHRIAAVAAAAMVVPALLGIAVVRGLTRRIRQRQVRVERLVFPAAQGQLEYMGLPSGGSRL